MAQTVIGFFDDATEAQRAVERLQTLGISREHVDISGGNASTSNVPSDSDSDSDRGNESGITRFFKSLFGDDDDDAERYTRVGQNSTIVTVHAQSDDQAERAADLLDECGAIDVDERSGQYGYSSNSERQPFNSNEEQTIDRIQENLEVGKREVERGGVRARSRIVERPVEEHIRLREENVYVERNQVDRPLTDSDRTAFQERDIELTERAEVPVVNKEARVVEEVRIGKEVNQRDEVIRDTVRDTEIDIDRIEGDNSSRVRNQTDNDLFDDDELNTKNRRKR